MRVDVREDLYRQFAGPATGGGGGGGTPGTMTVSPTAEGAYPGLNLVKTVVPGDTHVDIESGVQFPWACCLLDCSAIGPGDSFPIFYGAGMSGPSMITNSGQGPLGLCALRSSDGNVWTFVQCGMQ